VRTCGQSDTCYRKQLDQHDEFHHQRHAEYVQQHDLYSHISYRESQSNSRVIHNLYFKSAILLFYSKVVPKRVCTDRYPKTQQKSDDQPSRSPHMVVSCSSPCQYEQSCVQLAVALHFHFQRSYWIMSGRIGDWNTLGSGCVEPLALPSADRIVTVGREAIVMS
jgi:hypothetical protein